MRVPCSSCRRVLSCSSSAAGDSRRFCEDCTEDDGEEEDEDEEDNEEEEDEFDDLRCRYAPF